MGRDGFYYRASLGGGHKSSGSRNRGSSLARQPALTPEPALTPAEGGNVLEMVPVNSSHIIQHINEKMQRMLLWRWALGAGVIASLVLGLQPEMQAFALVLAICTIILSSFVFYTNRRAVVIMYNLLEDAEGPFRLFTEEFDKLATAQKIWNIDTSTRIGDWKRNAGATDTSMRTRAKLGYSVPRVIKTNIDVPSIVGGRHSMFFFPDIVLITERNHAGAISYEDLVVLWDTIVFIEQKPVPSDSQVLGYTWQYVNKSGGPDRRFSNNRQIPQVIYQQMTAKGPNNFLKTLHFSLVGDRSGFDSALLGLRGMIRSVKPPQIESPSAPQSASAPPVDLEAAKRPGPSARSRRRPQGSPRNRAELQQLESQGAAQLERLIETGEQVIAQCAERADAVLLNRSLADVRGLLTTYKFAVAREDFETAGKVLSMCGEDLPFTREVNEYMRSGHCSDPAAEDPAVLHADLREDQDAEQAQRLKNTIAEFEADYAPLVDKIPLLPSGSPQRVSLEYLTNKVRAELECAKVFADRSVSRGSWFRTKAREAAEEQRKLFQFCRDKGILKEKPAAS
jgi:hypothetical protein